MIFLPHSLPDVLPLYPLQGFILMPRVTVPLPIMDEAIYLEVQSIQRQEPTLGVVQPYNTLLVSEDEEKIMFFKTGCAGRILSLSPFNEGFATLTVQGLCRFEIIDELDSFTNLSHALVSYERYSLDMVQETDLGIDRPRLIKAMRPYFSQLEVMPDWEEIEKISNEKLLNTLAMVCPFDVYEKQAILETPGLQEQSQLMTLLLEMGSRTSQDEMSFIRYH